MKNYSNQNSQRNSSNNNTQAIDKIACIAELEVEKRVLNYFITENASFIHAKGMGICTDYFSDYKHKAIYEAIEKLNLENQPINLISVTQQLRVMGSLGVAGGPAYITELMSTSDLTNALEQYVFYLKEYDMRRKACQAIYAFMDKVPDEQYDIYEILKELSKAIDALLEDTPITDTLLKMPEVIENTLENVRLRIENKGKLMGVSTGIEALDHLIGGWLPGQSGVVGGRPGSGKTAFMLHLMKCFIRENKKILLKSWEMSPEDNILRLLKDATPYSLEKWRDGDFTPEEYEEIRKMAEEMSHWEVTMGNQWGTDIDELATMVKMLCSQNKCDVVLIDYCQLVTPSKGKSNRNREQEVAEISRMCKKLALTYNITVILVSQLKRESETHISGKPQLSDLRESGAIEQDADIVILLDQPAKRGKMIHKETGYPTENLGVAIVAKNRNGETGEALYGHDAAMLHIGDYVPPQEWLTSLAKKQEAEQKAKEKGIAQAKKEKETYKRTYNKSHQNPRFDYDEED